MENDKERDIKRKEERLTCEMYGEVTFISQCSGCSNNVPPNCYAFDVKPEIYRWNKKTCPKKMI